MAGLNGLVTDSVHGEGGGALSGAADLLSPGRAGGLLASGGRELGNRMLSLKGAAYG